MYHSSKSSRIMLDTRWDLKKCYGIEDRIQRDISGSDESKFLLQVNCKDVKIFDAADEYVQHIPIEDSPSAAVHRDLYRHVSIGTRSRNVLIWDNKNKNTIKTFPRSQCNVNFISYNATNTGLAAAMANADTVSISSMKFHNEYQSLGIATYKAHVLRGVAVENINTSPVRDLAFSPINKEVMLSTGYDKFMDINDIWLQHVVSTLRAQYPLTAMSLNIENELALTTKNGLVLVYDLRYLTTPFKVLQEYDEEVPRVSSEWIRKQFQSSEISLRERAETHMSLKQGSTSKISTPTINKTVDDIAFQSQSLLNELLEDGRKPNLNIPKVKANHVSSIDSNQRGEFKECVCLSECNTGFDYKYHFLFIIMAVFAFLLIELFT